MGVVPGGSEVGDEIGNGGGGQTAEAHLRETAKMVQKLVGDDDSPIGVVAKKMIDEIDGGSKEQKPVSRESKKPEKEKKQGGKWNKSWAWFATSFGSQFNEQFLNSSRDLTNILASSAAEVSPTLGLVSAGVFLAMEGASTVKALKEGDGFFGSMKPERVLGRELMNKLDWENQSGIDIDYWLSMGIGALSGVAIKIGTVVVGSISKQDKLTVATSFFLAKMVASLSYAPFVNLFFKDGKDVNLVDSRAFRRGMSFMLGLSTLASVPAGIKEVFSHFDRPDGNVAPTPTAPEPTHTQVAPRQPTETSVQPEHVSPTATPEPTHTPLPPTPTHVPATETSQPTAMATAMATATEAVSSIFTDSFLAHNDSLRGIMDTIHEHGFSKLEPDQRVALMNAAHTVDPSWQELGGSLTGLDVNGDGVLDVFHIGKFGYDLMLDGQGNFKIWDGVSNDKVWRTLKDIKTDWPEIDIRSLEAADAAIAAEGDK